MKEKIIVSILSKCLDFIDVEQCNQLRLVLEKELHNYNLEEVCTDLVPANQWQNKLLLYLASKKIEGLSDKTLKNYKLQLVDFANTMRKNFEDVDEMDIRYYIAMTMERGIKNSTISTVISILKTFFTWMYDNNYVPKNPTKLIKNIKVDKFIRKALTSDEIELLRYACKTPREFCLLELFFSTGARLTEIYQLNKNDINWNESSICVFGKGRKERVVYLNSKSKLYLHKYLNSREDDKEALFVTEKKPYNRLGKRSIEVFFKDLGKRANLNKPIFPHIVRHSFATSYLRSGGTLTEVARLLGHSSTAISEIYARLNDDDIKFQFKKHIN